MLPIVILSMVSVAMAQYPYQGVPGAGGHQSYQPQQYQQQPQPQSYQPQPQSYQPQQPAYQPPAQSYQPPAQQRVHNPAPIHYVNIGQQLQGDYKFGYDTGKGNDGQSFREETRLPDGSVKGAYGYVDESGKQRVVKYTAGKAGYVAEIDGVSVGAVSAPQNPHAAQPAQAPAYGGGYQQGNSYPQY